MRVRCIVPNCGGLIETPGATSTATVDPATDKLDRVAWAMLTTGMHAKEYWGAWANEATCIRIHGTQPPRQRSIPPPQRLRAGVV